ncbi:hypothetical protein FRC07_012069 [Ceratobasidium sp. 392]|nr:hypothetical protein FRC07_012069 [Ceratobasidium sp. 392]
MSNTRDLIVEYENRLVKIPCTPDYDVLITYLKRIFKSLEPLPSDCIAVTTHDEVENVTVEIVDFLWARYCHKVTRIGIKIQGNTNAKAGGEGINEPPANRNKRAREDETQESGTQAKQTKEDTGEGEDEDVDVDGGEDEDEYEDAEDDQYDDDTENEDSNYGSDTASAGPSTKRRRTRRFPTLPIQPRVWGNIRRKDTLAIIYTGGDEPESWKRILIKPETTFEDLQGFIESRSRVAEYVGEGSFTYVYGNSGSLVKEKTAGEIKRRSGGSVIHVHVPRPDSIFNAPEHFIRAVMNAGR